MRWIVLLRGVNVGGHGKTPMAELRQVLTESGAEKVQSYIQSGNLVFDHPEARARTVADSTTDLIDRHFGHRPAALAWTPEEIAALITANPFPDAAEPKYLTFHMFQDTPAADVIDRLDPYTAEGEEIILTDRCLYHWPPQGLGKSKVAQKVPTALGVTTTARNLNTMRRIRDLAQ